MIRFFNDSFSLIPYGGLWGVNANTNNYFADGVDKFGLYSIINSCLGYVNNKQIKLTTKEKEDFERCILFYQMKLPILKRTGFGIKTKYWTNKGGLNDDYNFEKRIKVQRDSAKYLMKKYPGMCYEHVRSNGLVDLRFRKDPLKLYK